MSERLAMTAYNPFELIRPLVWTAAVAFILGFTAYMLLGTASVARTVHEVGFDSLPASYAPAAGPTVSI